MPENTEEVRKDFSEADLGAIRNRFMQEKNLTGEDMDQYVGAFENSVRRQDPTLQSFTTDDIPYKDQNIEKTFFEDLTGGLYNSFVDLTEGVANIVPTAFTFSGAGGEFFDKWIDGVDAWAENNKMQQSDLANQGLAADFTNANAWGAAIGQGIGFIAQIFGTAGIGGAIAKGAEAGSMIGRASRIVGGGVQATGGARAGSFIAGTFNMYPALYREAKQSGLSSGAAARFSLTVASLVSATEGAALEWMGKSLARPVTNKLAQQTVRESIAETSKRIGKEVGKFTLKDIQNVSATAGKTFAKKLKAYAPKMTESAAVEFGQEFTQTYIEQGAKNIYDVTFGEKAGGQGEFGVEIFGKDKTRTFREALAGGLVGGLIGGGLGLGGSSIRGVKGETLGLAVESAQGNKSKLQDIHHTIDKMESLGELEEGSAPLLHGRVDNMNEFYEQIKGMGMESPTAKYQMYQMINLQEDYNKKFKDKITVTEDMNEVVAQTYNRNNKFAETITKSLNQEIAEITEKKNPVEWNKDKFEKKLDKYKVIYGEVLNNEITTEEGLNLALGKINKNFTGTGAGTTTGVSGTTEGFGKTYEKDGIKITQKALENMDEIRLLRNKAAELKGEERDAVFAEIKEKFGIDKAAINFLYRNKNLTAEDLTETQEVTDDAKVDAEELISYPLATINKAEDNEQIDSQEAEILRSIIQARENNDEELAEAFTEELEDYQQRKLEKSKKLKTRKEESQNKSLDLYKEYFEDEDIDALENELKNLTTASPIEKDEAQRLKKINYINNLLNDRAITNKRKTFVGDPSQLTYIQKVFSEELDNEIEDFYIAPDSYPTLYLKELSDDIYEVYNDIKNDVDFFNNKELRKKRKLILAELSKTINDIENEISKRSEVELTADEQALINKRKEATNERERAKEQQSEATIEAERKRKQKAKIEREQSKATVNEDTGKLELNLKVKSEEDVAEKAKKPVAKKKLKEIIPQGIEIGNFVVDIIGTAFQRIRVFSKATGKLASRKKSDEVLSTFSLDDKNLNDVVSSLTESELNKANAIANEYSVARLDITDEVDIQDSLDEAIFNNLKGRDRTKKLKRVGETREASNSWVVRKGSNEVGIDIDNVIEAIKGEPQFEGMDEQEIEQSIYDFVNTYDNIRDYNDSRVERTSEVKLGNISDNFKDLTGLPLTEENIGVVSSKVEALVTEKEEALKSEVQEEELKELVEAEKPQQKLDFEKTPTKVVEEVKEEESKEEQIPEEEISDEVKEAAEANRKYEEEINKIAEFYDPDLDEGRHQRAGEIDIDNALLVKDNIELYNKIKAHFRRIFPFISVKEVDRIGKKYGAQILARVIESGIEIDTNKAIQTSLIHEYAHIFVQVLGRNHPMIKLGMKMMIGTQFDLDAQRLYPIKDGTTRDDQLEEALMQAVAIDSLDKLKTKLDGSNLAKFLAWAKRMWVAVKRNFSKDKSKDIVAVISDALTFRNKTYTIGQGSLVGISKNQLQNVIENPIHSKTVDVVNSTLIQQRLEAISNKDKLFNHKNKSQIFSAAIQSMIQKYFKEKSNIEPASTVKIFEDVDFGINNSEDLANKEEYIERVKALTPQDIRFFGTQLSTLTPDVYKRVETVVNSMFKTNLEIDEIEDVVEVNSQEDSTKETDNSVKASKKLNPSVRSIVSSIVDEDGYKIDSDIVYQYIGHVAQNTLGRKGFLAKVQEDALKDVVPKRLLSVINALSPGDRNGLIKTISSLQQKKYVGLNTTIIVEENEEGDEVVKEVKVSIPVKNKDQTIGGKLDVIKNNFDKIKKGILKNNRGKLIKDLWVLTFGKYKSQNHEMILAKDPAIMKDVAQRLSEVTGLPVDKTNVNQIVSAFGSPKQFYDAMAGFRFHSFGTYFSQESGTGEETELSHINSWLGKIVNFFEDKSSLVNTFINAEGNTMSTTETADWMNDQNAMILHDKEYQERMLKSPIYKNNSVLKFFIERNKVEMATLDSVKNITTNDNVEYKDLSDNDFLVNKFLMFAANVSNEYYSQSAGVKSNRTNVTFVEAPRYTNQELKKRYDEQVVMLQKVYNDMVNNFVEYESKGKIITVEAQKTDVQNDFKKLYLHDISPEGVITSGYKLDNHLSKVGAVNRLIKNTDLIDSFAKRKIGKDKPYSSIEDMVTNFYYTEALNRTYLGDIYGGVALEYAGLVAGNTSKGGAQQAVKRLSGIDSNGETNEVDNDVNFLFHDGSVSDSFEINGRYYTEALKEDAGTLDPIGLVSKGQIMQVDPETGKSFYSKRSEYNLEKTETGNNLETFGETYNEMGNAIIKLEDYIEETTGVKPNITLADTDTMKGTFSGYVKHNIYELLDKISKGVNLDDIVSSMSKIKVRSQRTLHQLNKKLSDTHEQFASFGTRGAVLQLDFASPEQRQAYKDVAVRTLENELNEKEAAKDKSSLIYQLRDYSKSYSALAKDMNDRERSSTTELLEAIIEHNANPINTENQISVFDEPSLRLVYEQFIASKMTKNGVQIKMPGMFAHQAPDMDGKRVGEISKALKHNEIAVPWKFIWNEKPSQEVMNAFLASENNKIAVERIPTSSPVSMFAGRIAFFLDTESSTAVASDEFVRVSDSDHDGDKMMIYRQEIDDTGKFVKRSSMTKLFNFFHDNMQNPAFLEKQKGTDLDFEKELGNSLTELGLSDKEEFSVAGIDDEVKVAGKMKFGQYAVGRFAIAGKIMSLMSQANESLRTPIPFVKRDGTRVELEKFSNKNIDDNAIFLQAALDIGNNPILTATGFNMATIDIGTAMMQVATENGEILDKTDIIEFLNRPDIVKVSNDFKNSNSVYNNSKKKSLQEFLKKYQVKDTSTRKNALMSPQEIENIHGKDILAFIHFNNVAEGLSKMITFIQLDKNLPNNAEKTRGLLEDIEKFENLPFTTNDLVKDTLYIWRQQVLDTQNSIYKKNLLTANSYLNDIMDTVGKSLSNVYNVRKNAKEQVMQAVAQDQLSEQRKDVAKFIHDVSNKMKIIQNVAYLEDTEVQGRKHIKAIANLEGLAKQEAIDKVISRYKNKEDFAPELQAYEDALILTKEAQRFVGNSVFQHLQFNETVKGNGKFLMRLNPNFKSTEESKELFKKDFLALQKIDPQLAQELIDYQLYRWGTNNKRGSFIDGLPVNVKLKALERASEINNNEWVSSNSKEIKRNLILANKDLMPSVKNLKEYNGDFVILKDKIYESQLDESELKEFKKSGAISTKLDGEIYQEYRKGTFQSNEYFTAYENKDKDKRVVPNEEVEEVIEQCKLKVNG